MTKVNEIFVPINGTNGSYEISNCGRVKRVGSNKGPGYPKKDRFLFGNKDIYGYYRVAIPIVGVVKTVKIHQLVARHFINNPLGKNTVNHKDGNKYNNHISNLEWCTYAENNTHAYENGLKDSRGVKNGRSKLTENQVQEILVSNGRQKDIALKYGVNQTMVSAIKRKANWTHITQKLAL